MSYRVITPPSAEPITLVEARAHLRLDAEGSPPAHEDDNYVTALITVVRQWMEEYLRRALATQTIECSSDYFGCSFGLYGAPIQSITSVKYLDTAGVQQTLDPSAYYLVPNTAQLIPAYGTVWPMARSYPGSVVIRYVAGYSSAEGMEALPLPIKQGMLLLLAHLYENREEASNVNTFEIPMGLKHIVQPYRLGLGM